MKLFVHQILKCFILSVRGRREEGHEPRRRPDQRGTLHAEQEQERRRGAGGGGQKGGNQGVEGFAAERTLPVGPGSDQTWNDVMCTYLKSASKKGIVFLRKRRVIPKKEN